MMEVRCHLLKTDDKHLRVKAALSTSTRGGDSNAHLELPFPHFAHLRQTLPDDKGEEICFGMVSNLTVSHNLIIMQTS